MVNVKKNGLKNPVELEYVRFYHCLAYVDVLFAVFVVLPTVSLSHPLLIVQTNIQSQTTANI